MKLVMNETQRIVEAVAGSTGNYAPRTHNQSAADPVAFLRISTAAVHASHWVEQPMQGPVIPAQK